MAQARVDGTPQRRSQPDRTNSNRVNTGPVCESTQPGQVGVLGQYCRHDYRFDRTFRQPGEGPLFRRSEPAFGGEITYITRGRNQQRAAAIVPAELVEQYEAMIDLEDGRIALERLADLKSGRTAAVPADEAARALGL